MRRGQCIVNGIRLDGTLGEIDVLDLDERSYRAWTVDMFLRSLNGFVSQLRTGNGDEIIYRQEDVTILRQKRSSMVFGSSVGEPEKSVSP